MMEEFFGQEKATSLYSCIYKNMRRSLGAGVGGRHGQEHARRHRIRTSKMLADTPSEFYFPKRIAMSLDFFLIIRDDNK